MTVMIASSLTSLAFFLAPPKLHGVSARSALSLSVHTPHSSDRWIPRARLPLAFDSGQFVPFEEQAHDVESVLSADELKGLLRQRGVLAAHDASKAELLELLRSSTPSTGASLTLSPLESERVEVFERVSPAVAYIQTSVVASFPFALSASEYPAGAGSGFVWDANGHIVTNYHVVAGGPQGRPSGKGRQELPRKVTVKLAGMAEPVEASVVGFEADKDLAVLKVDPTKLPFPLAPLEVGTSNDLRVGQSVLAVGNPFGLDFTLTTGIVSALGRDIDGAGGRPIRDCVQTDAAINPGNSGGPLLDSAGRLIGVNTMIYAPGGIGGNVGIGFAVPVDTVRRIANQIIKYGNGARPSLGVSVLPDMLRKQYSKSLNRKLDGALIAEVVPGSPAADLNLAACQRQRGGIMLGDMITAVNGQPVTVNEDLLCAVEEAEPDQPLRLTVVRGCDPARVEELVVTPVKRNALSFK